MPNRLILVCVWMVACAVAQAEVGLDGLDDDITSGLALSTFMSASTGGMALWYVPTGTAGGGGQVPDVCYDGERLIGNWSLETGTFMGIFRHGNLSGADVLCAWNWDGTENLVVSTYTPNVPTHLAWIHQVGTLAFYKDGVQVGSIPAGDTTDMTAAFRLGMGPSVAGVGATAGQGIVVGVELFAVPPIPAEIRVKAESRLHRIGRSVRTGAWPLDECLPGTSGDGITFRDVSGNNRDMTGDNGPDDAGLLCRENTILTYPWGPE